MSNRGDWGETSEIILENDNYRFRTLRLCSAVILLFFTMLSTPATLPGMWERTLTIGSAGKTFNVTGWKIGWTIGPQNLIAALCTVHQNCNYTCPTPIQVRILSNTHTGENPA